MTTASMSFTRSSTSRRSGRIRSTPGWPSSGNSTPQSTISNRPSNSYTVMLRPISVMPPSATTRRDLRKPRIADAESPQTQGGLGEHQTRPSATATHCPMRGQEVEVQFPGFDVVARLRGVDHCPHVRADDVRDDADDADTADAHPGQGQWVIAGVVGQVGA